MRQLATPFRLLALGVLALAAAAPAQGQEIGPSLLAAARNGELVRLRSLIDRGADPTYANGAGVGALLAEGADPDAADARGSTALMDAASQGHADVVRLLIVRNADVNATDSKSDNALGAATRAGHETVVELLTDAGAEAPKKK